MSFCKLIASTLALTLCVQALPAQAAAVLEGTASWPRGVVKYRIDTTLLARSGGSGSTCAKAHTWRYDSAAFLACRAMREWSRKSGITFEADSAAPDVLLITSGPSTTAMVGYRIAGNRLTIKAGSDYGAILHEIGHALGLIHEHQRHDRDEYITLMPAVNNYFATCDSTSPQCRNFRLSYAKLPVPIIQSAYDPCSIMHYRVDQSEDLAPRLDLKETYTLTSQGIVRLQACAEQFAKLPRNCGEAGQKCAVSDLDGEIVRRFNGRE